MVKHSNKLNEDWHALQFDVRRSVRYHDRRIRFFDWLHRALYALMLLGGSGAMYAAISTVDSKWLIAVSATTAALAALNLVLEPARYARSHNDLKRRFIELEREINRTEPSDDAWVQRVDARLEIEADEPPVLRNLDTLCHNEMVKAYGYGEHQIKALTRWQRCCANVWDAGADQQIRAA